MPLKDEAGKRLSGSAQAKHAALGRMPMSAAAKRAFAELGPPPLAKPLEILGWARRVLATVTHLLARDELDPAKARAIKDSVFALGATHNRAELETTVARLQKALEERRQDSGVVRVMHGSKITRPATARGQSLGGPRIVLEGDASVTPPPDAPTDEEDPA